MQGFAPVCLADQDRGVADRQVAPLQGPVTSGARFPATFDLVGEGVVVAAAGQVDHQPLEAFSGSETNRDVIIATQRSSSSSSDDFKYFHQPGTRTNDLFGTWHP